MSGRSIYWRSSGRKGAKKKPKEAGRLGKLRERMFQKLKQGYSFCLFNCVNREGKDEMPKDLIAKLALSKEEIAHLYQGGVLSVKIKGKDTEVSVEISCREFSEPKGTRIRFKTIDAE
jgi:hypothetical protein